MRIREREWGGSYRSLSLSFCYTFAVSEDEELRPFHFLVFINPVGGPGRAITEFKQHVQPMFDLAEINYNIIVTGQFAMWMKCLVT